MQRLAKYRKEIEYPTSDGEPMGETDLHRNLMIDLIEALKHYYSRHSDVYVSGNIVLFFEEGNPTVHISPDVLVTLGAPPAVLQSYKTWELGAPNLVIEVTSRSTKTRDIGMKKGTYAALGVQEYLLFDPQAEYLKPRFKVFRLQGEEYEQVIVNPESGYQSLLGLTFHVVDDTLRISETATGRLLLRPFEQAARAEQEAARAEQEAAQKARLLDQLRRLGVEPEI
jgi:Uma2 family endonuclease